MYTNSVVKLYCLKQMMAGYCKINTCTSQNQKAFFLLLNWKDICIIRGSGGHIKMYWSVYLAILIKQCVVDNKIFSILLR